MKNTSSPNTSIVLSVGILYKALPEKNYTQKLQDYLARLFKYYEIIIAIDPFDADDTVQEQLCAIPNTHLLILNRNAPDDVQRQKIFEHAIGDFVLLLEPEEAELHHIEELIETTLKHGADYARLIYNTQQFLSYRMLNAFFFFIISGISRHNVDGNLSYTGCYGRAMVNAITSEAVEGSLRVQLAAAGFRGTTLEGARNPGRSMKQIFRRLGRCIDIIGSVPHRLLRLTALLSLCASFSNIVYLLYVIGVWVFLPQVQPGWTISSLVQTSQSALLFFLIFVFSCVFSANIDAKEAKRFIVAKILSRNDFITTFKDINVDKE